jgi:hypothetical protein
LQNDGNFRAERQACTVGQLLKSLTPAEAVLLEERLFDAAVSYSAISRVLTKERPPNPNQALSQGTLEKTALVIDDLVGIAPKVSAPSGWRPAIEFDELKGVGEATTPGLIDAPNFDEFLLQAGYDPAVYEVVGNTVRTSKWQQREGGEWLTSFRFTFRLKNAVIDLPLPFAQARKTKPPTPPQTASESVLLVCWSDTQTGKVASGGGTAELIARVKEKQAKLEAHLKKHK